MFSYPTPTPLQNETGKYTTEHNTGYELKYINSPVI